MPCLAFVSSIAFTSFLVCFFLHLFFHLLVHENDGFAGPGSAGISASHGRCLVFTCFHLLLLPFRYLLVAPSSNLILSLLPSFHFSLFATLQLHLYFTLRSNWRLSGSDLLSLRHVGTGAGLCNRRGLCGKDLPNCRQRATGNVRTRMNMKASGEAQPQTVQMTSDELAGGFPELDHKHVCGLSDMFTAERRNCIRKHR